MNTRNIHPPHLQPTDPMKQENAIRHLLEAQQQSIPVWSNEISAAQTPWTHYPQRVYPKFIAPQSWLSRKSLQEPSRYARAFGIGFCMLVAVGVVAGLIWLMEA